MNMEDKIKAVKEKLSCIDTEELLGIISLHFTTFANANGEIQENLPFQFTSELMSPQKQYFYLAGLLMSTQYKGNGKENNELLLSLEKDIQEITQDYIKGFIGDKELFKEEKKEKFKQNLVSMDAFVSYFDTGVLRYNEQTEELIKTLYSPFDDELVAICGLKTSDYIDFFNFVTEKMTDAKNRMQDAFNELQRFLASFNQYETNPQKIEKEYQRLLNFGRDNPETFFKLQEGFTGNNKFKKQDVIDRYGKQKGEKLLELFALERKERDFKYYNGNNPFISHPLCWLNQDTLYSVSPQILLNAIFDCITDFLENPKNKFSKKYWKTKADIVEQEFLKCFKSVFHEDARYHMAVCEKPGTQEHDILIEFKNYILIAEVKASKVREPFFNPEKAYIRIKDHFFSESGIGYAYNQACILKKKIETETDIVLYEDMRKPFELHDIQSKNIIPIVLTLNQFGGIAINTSLLLTPEEGQSYPWVCNLHDFQNLIEILNYLKKTEDDFVEYVEWRSIKHKDIIASDELDIVEQYFTIPKMKKEAETVFIANNVKRSLIDKIYFEKLGLAFPDVNSEHEENNEVSTVFKSRKKVYPNDLCPCGSGKKFKKCHKGKGIYDIRMIYVHVEVEKSSKNVIREKVYMINKNLQMKNYLIAPKRNCY